MTRKKKSPNARALLKEIRSLDRMIEAEFHALAPDDNMLILLLTRKIRLLLVYISELNNNIN